MKILQSDLERRVAVSTGNRNPNQIHQKVVDLLYDTQRADLEQNIEEAVYGKEVKEYMGAFSSWTAIPRLKDALIRRGDGERVLSFREADIAARLQADLEDRYFLRTFFEFGGMLVEGDPKAQGNAYLLRSVYNRGIRWKIDMRSRASEEMQRKGDEKLEQTIEALIRKQLPPWPKELERGFHQDLLKPEYLSWSQFESVSQHLVKEVTL